GIGDVRADEARRDAGPARVPDGGRRQKAGGNLRREPVIGERLDDAMRGRQDVARPDAHAGALRPDAVDPEEERRAENIRRGGRSIDERLGVRTGSFRLRDGSGASYGGGKEDEGTETRERGLRELHRDLVRKDCEAEGDSPRYSGRRASS